MPRKIRNKRLRKSISSFLLKYNKEVAAIDELMIGYRAGMPLLEQVLGFKFSANGPGQWRMAVDRLNLPPCGATGRAGQHLAAGTEIDRPFAKALRVAWKLMPAHCRGKSPEALIARARRLRRIGPVSPTDRFFLAQRQTARRMLAVLKEYYEIQTPFVDKFFGNRLTP